MSIHTSELLTDSNLALNIRALPCNATWSALSQLSALLYGMRAMCYFYAERVDKCTPGYTLQESQIATLAKLRKAAEARDPERCQFLLKALFMDLDFYLALAVVIERARSFLETFETYYPDGVFARQILMQMVNTGTAPARLPPEALRDFEQPGAANFMKALADLAHALQPGALPPRIGYLVSATVNAIMAELVEQYYGPRPQAWAQFRAEPANSEIAYAFWTDEDVALLDTDHWLQVADSVERQMQRQYGTIDQRD